MKDKNFTGIPKELQPWEGFTRDSQSIKISVDKRRYGKNMTIIEGIDPKSEDIYEIVFASFLHSAIRTVSPGFILMHSGTWA